MEMAGWWRKMASYLLDALNVSLTLFALWWIAADKRVRRN